MSTIALNATALDNASNSAQNVTGQVLLWAVIAIALTAVSQQSVTASYCNLPGSKSELSMGVYRISPLFCITDTIIELHSIVMVFVKWWAKRTGSYSDDPPELCVHSSGSTVPGSDAEGTAAVTDPSHTLGAIAESDHDKNESPAPNDDESLSTSAPSKTGIESLTVPRDEGRIEISTTIHDEERTELPSLEEDAYRTESPLPDGDEDIIESSLPCQNEDLGEPSSAAKALASELLNTPERMELDASSKVDIYRSALKVDTSLYDILRRRNVNPDFSSGLDRFATACYKSGCVAEIKVKDEENIWKARLPYKLLKQIHDQQDDIPAKQYVFWLYDVLCRESGDDFPRIPATKKEILSHVRRMSAWYDDETAEESTGYAAYFIRIMLFVLGAVPQAFKIFATEDILFTQLLAAVYLLAIGVHGVTNAVKTVADSEETRIPFQWRYDCIWSLRAAHYLFYSACWYHMSRGIVLAPTESLTPIYNALLQTREIVGHVNFALAMALMFSMPFSYSLRRLIDWCPWFYICNNIFSFICDVVENRARSSRHSTLVAINYVEATFGLTVSLLSLPFLACIGVAWVVRRSFGALIEDDDVLRVYRAEDLIQKFEEVEAEYKDAAQNIQHRRVIRLRWSWYERFMDGTFDLLYPAVWPYVVYQKAQFWFSQLHPDVQWVCFVLFNLLTLTLYYTACFDGMATVVPGWIGVFG